MAQSKISAAALAAAAAVALPPKVDILLWGVTGFTGALLAEYAAERYGNNSVEQLTFGLGGRNRAKIEEIKANIAQKYPAILTWPVFVGDGTNQQDMDEVVQNARVVATTAGPYSQFGLCLVDACVRFGVDYVDITGEVGFMKMIVDKYDAKAREKRVLIVPSCGFDCIPADLCVMLVENTAREMIRREIDYTYGAFFKIKGGIGGGTIASAFETFSNRATMFMSPWALTPDPKPRAHTAHDGDQHALKFIPFLNWWTVPFMLSFPSIRTINRSLYLRGKNYAYSEGLKAPNWLAGVAMWLVMGVLVPFVLWVPFTRAIIRRFLPKPGEGPSRQVIENGEFHVRTMAVCKPRGDEKPRRVFATCDGKRDPGFGGTVRMLLESAVTIAKHKSDLVMELPGDITGGVLTPSVALGRRLVERLQANADIHLDIQID